MPTCADTLAEAIHAVQTHDAVTRDRVIAEDLITHFPGRSRLAGDLRGRGVVAARLLELTGGTLNLEAVAVLGATENWAAGLYRMSVRCPDGRGIEWDHLNLYRIEDGVIVEVWQNPLTEADRNRVDEFVGRR